MPIDVAEQSGGSESTSLTLLERAKENDCAAWDRLHAFYRPRVYYWCSRKGINAEDAADVSQDVFISVFSKINDFQRRKRGAFRSWLASITSNKIVDHYRRKGKVLSVEEMAELPEPEPCEYEQQEMDPRFKKTLADLRQRFNPQHWNAFWRMTVDQQTASCVASELGMTKAAVNQANYRVRKELRRELDGLI